MFLWVDDNAGILFIKRTSLVVYREFIRAFSCIKKIIVRDSKLER